MILTAKQMPTHLNHVIIAPTSQTDLEALAKLHAVVFGPGRFARTAYRVREGQPSISAFCRTAKVDGYLIASVTYTPIYIGARSGALLLGPLAVAGAYANIGIGGKLIATSLEAAKNEGIRLVVLVGELAYYKRFGFVQVPPGQICLPGPADPARILACKLDESAMCDYRGLISAF